MKVTQEKLSDSQIALEIEISAENTKQTYDKMVQDLARNTKIPGFRQGKVPRHVLLQRLGIERIKAAALDELIQKNFAAALEQESIKSLGNYKLRSDFNGLVEQYKPGEPLIFSASCDVPPTVDLGEYQNLSVKAEEVVFDPSKVDEWLEEKREKQATLVPVEDRPAKVEDVVIIDYQAFEQGTEGEKGEEIPGLMVEDFEMELREEKFIPGFVSGIVGMELEETKSVAVTFPEDYQQEDLAGKSVVFSITLKEVKEKELPELDDEFAKDVSEFETMAALRESLENQLRKNAEQETKNNIHSAILEQLLKQCHLELPETMIQEEVNDMLTQKALQMQKYGVDVRQLFTSENIKEMRKRWQPEAIKTLSTSVILKEIAARESMEVSPEELEAKFKEVMATLSGKKNKDVDEERLRGLLKDDLLTEKALAFLQEKVTVELVLEGSLAESEEVTSEETPAVPMGEEMLETSEELVLEGSLAKSEEVTSEETPAVPMVEEMLETSEETTAE
ncbi:MAG: trigger factor [Gomphosphaeria aponina SAG 52.96 = DSM 107014]|uniref:Trigger factor n=1 Tax=Gomphosphaeria aponina SAG 52.96 = DSM 107014 TaxID=1521640 RepID=A0A941GR46_9CHRO|nr:trigger factor [Gomphosphaeria aponina SAG 52.96 = DSM 107014]